VTYQLTTKLSDESIDYQATTWSLLGESRAGRDVELLIPILLDGVVYWTACPKFIQGCRHTRRSQIELVLVEQGMVGEVLDDAEGADMNYLADHARKIIAAAGGEPPGEEAPRVITRTSSDLSKAGDTDLTDLRDWVTSILLAQQAAKDKEVQAFRKEFLGDKLLEHSEVEGWIHKQDKTDAPLTWYLVIPVVLSLDGPILTKMPKEARAEQGDIARWTQDERYGIPELETEELKHITYSVPGHPWLRWQFTTPGGVLERLWYVSDHLINSHYSSGCPAYPWNRGQATMFVLTGMPPK
jgi:hypothetical protein